jgi:ribosomal-protein-alanine N-acetyltransferase
MCERDLEAVVAIESASFSHPWSRTHFLDEIGSPCGRPTVAVTSGGVVAGYLCLKLVLDEVEILDLAVNYLLRGRGIGRMLVEDALFAGRSRGATVVFLEVRLGNEKAIALYRRLGFREAGRRKSYYHDGEDAWLMQYRYMDQAKECNAV